MWHSSVLIFLQEKLAFGLGVSLGYDSLSYILGSDELQQIDLFLAWKFRLLVGISNLQGWTLSTEDDISEG